MLRPVLFSPYTYLYIASPSTGMLMTLSSSFLSLLEKDSSFFYPSRTLVSNPGPGEPARFSVVPVLTHLIQLISSWVEVSVLDQDRVDSRTRIGNLCFGGTQQFLCETRQREPH